MIQFSPPTPESVEWLNSIIGTVWPLISPDMFVAVADQIEDIMQVRNPIPFPPLQSRVSLASASALTQDPGRSS